MIIIITSQSANSRQRTLFNRSSLYLFINIPLNHSRDIGIKSMVVRRIFGCRSPGTSNLTRNMNIVPVQWCEWWIILWAIVLWNKRKSLKQKGFYHLGFVSSKQNIINLSKFWKLILHEHAYYLKSKCTKICFTEAFVPGWEILEDLIHGKDRLQGAVGVNIYLWPKKTR